MAAHRYWRVRVTTNGGDAAVSCVRLDFRATIGGANVASGGVPIRSSEYAGREVAYAFDASTSTWWSSNNELPCWIGYDFGAGTEQDIVEFAWTVRSDDLTRAPGTSALEWSDDASSWTTAFSTDLAGWFLGETRSVSGGTVLAVRASQAVVMVAAEPHPAARVGQAVFIVAVEEAPPVLMSQIVVMVAVREAISSGCVTRVAYLWTIERRDGVTLRLTSHDTDLTIKGLLYHACDSFDATALEGSADLATDNLDLMGSLSSGLITEADLDAGRYDFARVTIALCRWDQPEHPPWIARRGRLGQITRREVDYTAEFRGLAQLLQQGINEGYAPLCSADLGDSRCRYAGQIDFQGLSIGIVRNDRRIFDVSGLPAGDLVDGRVTFTLGDNLGFSGHIKAVDGSTIELWEDLPYEVVPTDEVTIRLGCGKTPTACKGYGNFVNFRGFPAVPGGDEVGKYPDSKV